VQHAKSANAQTGTFACPKAKAWRFATKRACFVANARQENDKLKNQKKDIE
jgi:hypothetical protein